MELVKMELASRDHTTTTVLEPGPPPASVALAAATTTPPALHPVSVELAVAMTIPPALHLVLVELAVTTTTRLGQASPVPATRQLTALIWRTSWTRVLTLPTTVSCSAR